MQIVTRSQRRKEKQFVALLLVIATIALVSFGLGFILGRGSAGRGSSAPSAALAPAPTAAAANPAIAPAAKELTFYDTLPKGEQAPLGSGINLPRETPAAISPSAEPPGPAETTAADPLSDASVAATKSPQARNADAAAPVVEPVAAVSAPAGKGDWVVQIASSKAAEDARKIQERLVGKGFRALIREADLGEKGRWYRVVIGPYASNAEAGQTADRLQKEGMSGLVRKD